MIGRGNQRESWFRRSESGAFPCRSGSAAKSRLRSRTIASKSGLWLGFMKTKWCWVAEVQTSRMLLSGREIQTFCPAGIGCPSLGAGRRRPFTSTVVGADELGVLGAFARKSDLLSCCHTVSDTPEVYLPGCLRTASIPAFRKIE
jgi:hypothetical protein